MTSALHSKTVLFCGPLPPPLTGQATSFLVTVNGIEAGRKKVVSQNFTGKKWWIKIVGRLVCILKYIYYLCFYKVNVIYFTSSRSFFGCLSDIALINLARLKNIKIVNHIHGDDFDTLFSIRIPFFPALIKYSYNYKRLISIVLLEGMKKKIPFLDQQKIYVVPNCYDPELDKMNPVKQKHDGVIRLLFLSNIMAFKGIIQVLDAFEILVQKYPHIQLHIAGGILGDSSMSAAEIGRLFPEKIKNIPNIKFYGSIHGQQKYDLLAKSDIFILPTYHPTEAFPLSILEAYRAGCAVITTAHNYLPEIVGEANGVLVPVKDAAAIVDAVTVLVGDEEKLRCIQEHNIRFVQEHYSYQQYISHIDRLLNS